MMQKSTETLAHGYSSESILWELINELVPIWQGFDGFQRSFRHYSLEESSLSIGRVKAVFHLLLFLFVVYHAVKLLLKKSPPKLEKQKAPLHPVMSLFDLAKVSQKLVTGVQLSHSRTRVRQIGLQNMRQAQKLKALFNWKIFAKHDQFCLSDIFTWSIFDTECILKPVNSIW